MISIKTKKEIDAMKKGGSILREVLKETEAMLKPGLKTREVDAFVEKRITEKGGEPGFKRVKGYSWATCVCVNDQIVHTPPSDRVLRDGDVITVDAGVFYGNLHTDSALTVQIGTQTKDIQTFLETGRKALKKALAVTKVGNRIGHISQAFQETIEGAGYSIVRELTGHGVGHELHEDPYIPCFISGQIEKTALLKPGMTLAIEVMYAMGDPKIIYEDDGWSLKMADNSPSATFEHTVALTENRTLILT